MSLRRSQNDGEIRARWPMTQTDLGRQPPQPLVVARLLGDVGEQVPEPPAGEAQEAPLGGAVEEDLGNGERDELGVGEPWPATGTRARRQEIVHRHIKCGEQGVEFGEHAASLVDVADATPNFGARVMSPRATPRGNSESLI
jgi:hypothetical protein